MCDRVLNTFDAEVYFFRFFIFQNRAPWCKRRCAVTTHHAFSSSPNLLFTLLKKCKCLGFKTSGKEKVSSWAGNFWLLSSRETTFFQMTGFYLKFYSPAGNYLLRTRCYICSKLTIKKPERRSGFFTGNLKTYFTPCPCFYS